MLKLGEEEMNFMEEIYKKASAAQKTIILPEGNDERILRAASIASKNSYAKIIVLGDENLITPDNFKVINPKTSEKKEEYAALLYELRKNKGMSKEEADKLVLNHDYFANLMVKSGDADGVVSGATHSTADTIRPALQIIKSKREGESVSGVFIMIHEGKPYIFADCAIIPEPDAKTLADIAIQSAATALSFGIPAHIAMLSFSTKGSAEHALVSKVRDATLLAQNKAKEVFPDKDIIIDGELQFDAAFVPNVAASKCKDSPLKGKARVFIFPDLSSGNICYKLAQRMGNCEAYGPALQGLKSPVNDLSRGCLVEDIVGLIAITSLQI